MPTLAEIVAAQRQAPTSGTPLRGLLDIAQGASNAAAGNVAGPVDLLAMGLRKVGIPVPAVPIGGTEWMRQRGLIREPEGRMAGLLGEAAGMALPIVAAAKAPQIAQGLLQMGENMRAPTPMNAATRWQAGAIVYHGSPHKFDKFDSSKIGTGEGSQAQGHGLYFAENKAVADEYRKALSDGLGHTYKVDLPDAEIAKMIDWDKPWSQQSESVRKAINTDALERFYNTKDLPASQVLFHLNQGRAPADSAAYLQSIGVPGVKYLDQGSRSAGGETRNFVVFPGNEGLLKILGRE